jgi:hypothetical protein
MKVKNLLILIPVILGCLFNVPTSFSQEDGTGSPMLFGIKAGGNLNYLSMDQPHIGYTPGYHGGIFMNYGFSDLLGIQAEVNYIQQGGQFIIFYDDTRFGNTPVPFPYRVENALLQMHNIDLQVLADIKMPSPFETISLRVGPAIAFNLSSEINSDVTFQQNSIFFTYSDQRGFTESTPFYQIGAVGGIGFKIPAGGINILTDIYYRYGITTSVETHSYINYASVVSDLTAHSISVSLGVAF